MGVVSMQGAPHQPAAHVEASSVSSISLTPVCMLKSAGQKFGTSVSLWSTIPTKQLREQQPRLCSDHRSRRAQPCERSGHTCDSRQINTITEHAPARIKQAGQQLAGAWCGGCRQQRRDIPAESTQRMQCEARAMSSSAWGIVRVRPIGE